MTRPHELNQGCKAVQSRHQVELSSVSPISATLVHLRARLRGASHIQLRSQRFGEAVPPREGRCWYQHLVRHAVGAVARSNLEGRNITRCSNNSGESKISCLSRS